MSSTSTKPKPARRAHEPLYDTNSARYQRERRHLATGPKRDYMKLKKKNDSLWEKRKKRLLEGELNGLDEISQDQELRRIQASFVEDLYDLRSFCFSIVQTSNDEQ
jgi:hypothetical protein